jgi:hypothetical protein
VWLAAFFIWRAALMICAAHCSFRCLHVEYVRIRT